MARHKAPGADGLTVDVVRECWEFVGDECVRVVQTICAKKRLLRADTQGLIKLIPKGGEKKLLSNWRPISLINLTYKIVTKILATRVRSMMPQLVDPQQSGFIQGRFITDNVLSLKLGQEWAKWTDQKALFVKLDFIKAYDRVDHTFLWMVLEKLGFDQTFLSLVKGLTCEGSAKVHINGSFTPEIRVERGVRQGCPLAPLLFALCTQPFMSMLKQSEEQGRISGLQIEPGRSLLYQLFADDTGVFIGEQQENFIELQRILTKYESASRAKINLCKSLVMPLGGLTVPDWVRRLGCEIAEGDHSFKYLGVLTRVSLNDAVNIQEALRRLNRRILEWENFYLPWADSWMLWLLRVWFQFKKKLRLQEPVITLPAHLPIASLKWIWGLCGRTGVTGFQQIEKLAKQQKAVTLSDVHSEEDGIDVWRFVEEGQITPELREVGQWLASIQIQDCKLENVAGWCWEGGQVVHSKWKLSNAEWTKLKWACFPTYEGLSRNWEIDSDNESWNKRWKLLWGGASLISHRVCIWRLLQQGLPTLERARKWGVSDGFCKWCAREAETVKHVIWGCCRLRSRVQWLSELVLGDRWGSPTFIQILDKCFHLQATTPSALVLLSEHCRFSWLERNKHVFDNPMSTALAWQILGSAKVSIKVRWRMLKGERAILIQAHDKALLDKAMDILVVTRARWDHVQSVIQEIGLEENGDLRSPLRPTHHGHGLNHDLNQSSSEGFRT
ncbi:hypothetical protein R1sor_017525 [Riccia sorocarpa]|uniref:Reverse transcriptase domain-containing protein n=1 Tax=Riccia sorocarpa TaxID=122646 RepID=A0ABD3I7F4_9MARC